MNFETNNFNSGEPPQSFLKKPVFWVIVAVVFVLVIVLVYFLPSLNLFTPNTDYVTPDSNQVVINPLPENYQYNSMLKDEYPIGFPQELMVSGGEWQRAEDTTAIDGSKIKIVEIKYSNIIPKTLAASFEASFAKADWEVINSKNENDLVVKTFIKNKDRITLTVVPLDKDCLANIALTSQ